MNVEIGKNGVIYCNTVRYNWKQARNLIADGSYGNMSGCWNFVNGASYVDSFGYKSYRSFKVPYGAEIQQDIKEIIANHKYYLSCRVYSTNNFDRKIYIKGTGIDHLDYFNGGVAYGGTNWGLVSVTFSSNYSSSAQLIFKPLTENATEWVNQFILIDLTDTFGEGNEPSREWCDNNIREHEVIVNFGCVSNNIPKSDLNRYYVNKAENYGPFNYQELPGNWEPQEYMYMMKGNIDNVEGYIYSQSTFALENTATYYAYVEYHRPIAYANDHKESIQFYFPEAEPLLGESLIVSNKDFNGGGGMREWKRASAFNNRNTFSNGNYKLRIDYNNNKRINELRLTAINLLRISDNISQYNSYNNTNISETDVNKEWCDRWIDGRSSPIIHIKDPNNVKIDYSKFGDIICNDIEIRPELNEVKFDYSTGTIYCKKLVKTQTY